MEKVQSYDVVVVGGGAAGIAAAVGAAQAGAACLLVERNGSLGGQATNANVASYCGFFTHSNPPQQIVRGVGQQVLELLHELGAYDGYRLSSVQNAIVTLDEEALKYALDLLVQRYSGLKVLLHCRMNFGPRPLSMPAEMEIWPIWPGRSCALETERAEATYPPR